MRARDLPVGWVAANKIGDAAQRVVGAEHPLHTKQKQRSTASAMMRYGVVIEKAEGNYSAYVPDLPGCVATGGTVEEVEKEVREAIRLHLEGLEADGKARPQPSAICQYVDL